MRAPYFLLSTCIAIVLSQDGSPRLAEPWAKLPHKPSIPVEEFEISITDHKLDDLTSRLLTDSNLMLTYENSNLDQDLGVNYTWMEHALSRWSTDFSWRGVEEQLNEYPHYMANVMGPHKGIEFNVHFVGLFSENTSAIPVALFHGWPGSFTEYLGLLDVVIQQYTPQTSPYHLVVPSLPGFTFSSGPPLDSDWTLTNTTYLMQQLLHGLGFSDGYVAQGGDIGSFVARNLGFSDPSCKAVHVNMIPSIKPNGVPDPTNDTSLTQQDLDVLERSQVFVETQTGYSLEHGTKPATIAFALANNPTGQLAWIGEKLWGWTDPSEHFSIDTILTSVSLYYLTDTFPRSLYSYRETSGSTRADLAQPLPYLGKPFGYTRFPYDNTGVPESWAAETGDMVFYKAHESGGHFAAWERPEALWKDVQEFLGTLSWCQNCSTSSGILHSERKPEKTK